MAQDTQKREGHFNGHTWIVVIVAIIGLISIALAEIFTGLTIIKTVPNLIVSTTTEICLATVPIQVITGIVVIIKRITYIPKGEKQ